MMGGGSRGRPPLPARAASAAADEAEAAAMGWTVVGEETAAADSEADAADLAAADAAAAAALPAGIASSELGLIIFLRFGEYSDADKGLARNSLAMVVAVIGFLKRRLQSAAVWGWLTYWQAALLETIFHLDGASQARARDVRPEPQYELPAVALQQSGQPAALQEYYEFLEGSVEFLALMLTEWQQQQQQAQQAAVAVASSNNPRWPRCDKPGPHIWLLWLRNVFLSQLPELQ